MEVVAFFLTTIRNLVILIALLLQISVSSTSARDTITPSQPLMDNNQTIVSSGQTFALGFFRPSNSKNSRYLGIWFNKLPIQTIVWIANRDNPLNDSSGVLKINSNGILVLVNQNSDRVIWSSSSVNHSILENPIAQLLDTGNLVIKSESSDHDHEPNSYIWESFDYPCHNFISGMKLGWNLKAGLNRNLVSWQSYEDPSPGGFTLAIDPRGNPQGIVQNMSTVVFRLGPWNGVHFSGVPAINNNSQLFVVSFVNNKEEIYCRFKDVSVISRVELNPSGLLHHFTWNNRSLQWNVLFATQQDLCGTYGLCGVNGICNIEDTIVCKCLDGFVPKSPEEWDQVDWSSGCRRATPLASDCSNGDDGFKKFPSVNLPDTKFSWVNVSMTLDECKMKCLSNCSCSAYANSDIRGGGSGCVLWFGDLLDIRTFAAGTGQDLFVRMAASELGSMVDGGSNEKKRVMVIACVSAILGMLLVALVIWYFIWKVNRRNQEIDSAIELERETELPLFHFGSIVRATNKFSSHNLLGEGGFGPVYKGKLSSGQEVAVKRLSKDSGQGLNEFKNEVILIAKLQHRNLVRLLGCCIERKELMLIYEYMPNKSLDSFIFDHAQSRLLNWQKRFDIITGVAQGLLYLHRDSRLRVIHRDLKASNVLLDSKMNPKISDFGLARTFGGDQTQENTGRVVGTFGYMSPEYAVDGIFSMKSDVFSFGVLMLEIVSGKRNRGIFHYRQGNHLNLLGHAWKLWNEEKGLELLDKVLQDKFNESQVLRCIQVGLLCVQLHPEDRPTMPSVVMMLGSELDISVQPKQPGYYYIECSSSSSVKLSDNKISMTALKGR